MNEERKYFLGFWSRYRDEDYEPLYTVECFDKDTFKTKDELMEWWYKETEEDEFARDWDKLELEFILEVKESELKNIKRIKNMTVDGDGKMEKLYYIVEMNMNEKQLNEMDALELDNIEQGLNWIKDSMESDAEYFNIDINYNIETIKYEQYGSDLDFYYKALVYIEYNDIVTPEMVNSGIYSVEDIIESNLSIISEIKTRMVKR